jgi:hypothetical protein
MTLGRDDFRASVSEATALAQPCCPGTLWHNRRRDKCAVSFEKPMALFLLG